MSSAVLRLLRRTVVAVVVLALLPTHAYAAARSVPAAPALTIEQVGARELRVTNTGAAAVRLGALSAKGPLRALGVDPASSCPGTRVLDPGASCAVVLRPGVVPHGSRVSPLAVTTTDGGLTVQNAGTRAVRLTGLGHLRSLGVRGGSCIGLRTLAPGAACGLDVRPGAGAAAAARLVDVPRVFGASRVPERLVTFGPSADAIAAELARTVIGLLAIGYILLVVAICKWTTPPGTIRVCSPITV